MDRVFTSQRTIHEFRAAENKYTKRQQAAIHSRCLLLLLLLLLYCRLPSANHSRVALPRYTLATYDERNRATLEGTARYRERLTGRAATNHFRLEQNLWLSSLGIGTYLGNADRATDHAYRETVVSAVKQE